MFKNYTCLDLETTGLDANICDILEIAMIKVRDGEIVDRLETFVYTPLEISEHITYLTGITTKDVQEKPDFVTLIPKIQEFIGDDALVGHNIWFDWNFLTQKGVKITNNPLWDTYSMSNILYPELPSHSLETNTKYFGIGHEDSHRAMADVMASHELWKILMETQLQISDEQREQLERLSKQSKWPLIDFFLQQRAPKKHPLVIPDTQLFHPQQLEPRHLNKELGHLFIHARGHDPVDVALSLDSAGKTLYVAGYEHTLEKLQQVFPNASRLLSPFSYLSELRKQELWKKSDLGEGETTFLLKTILHPEATSKEELVLSHPERGIWKDLHTSEVEEQDIESNYQKAYKKSLLTEKVITSHFHIFKDLEYVDHFDRVVILEPQLIEDNATTSFGKAMYRDQWDQQSSDEDWQRRGEYLFSQLDRLGGNLVPASQYPEHVVLTPMIVESNEFVRLKTAMIDLSQDNKDSRLITYLKYYLAFFQSLDPSWIRWLTVDPKRGVSLHLAPLSVKSLLEKHLFNKLPAAVISDTASSFPILPDMERPPAGRAGWDISIANQFKLNLPDLDSIKGTKKEGDHPAIIGYLAEQLPKLKGKTGVIFSSKSVLKRYFFDLVKVLPEDILMIGEDISGGTGKLRDRYLSGDQPSKVLFLTYRNLRAFPAEVMDFDQIIVQCLPFDPPGYPVNQARADLVNNPFMEYAMPKTKQYMLEIVSNFGKREGVKTLIIADRRVQEQDYGEDILQNLIPISPSSV